MDDLAHDAAIDVGEAEVAAGVAVRQLGVVEAHQVQQGRVQVVDVDLVLDGAEAVENKVHIHDFHATILHLLGLNHEKLTYRYAGRDFRLTDVKGEVVRGIFA